MARIGSGAVMLSVMFLYVSYVYAEHSKNTSVKIIEIFPNGKPCDNTKKIKSTIDNIDIEFKVLIKDFERLIISPATYKWIYTEGLETKTGDLKNMNLSFVRENFEEEFIGKIRISKINDRLVYGNIRFIAEDSYGHNSRDFHNFEIHRTSFLQNDGKSCRAYIEPAELVFSQSSQSPKEEREYSLSIKESIVSDLKIGFEKLLSPIAVELGFAKGHEKSVEMKTKRDFECNERSPNKLCYHFRQRQGIVTKYHVYIHEDACGMKPPTDAGFIKTIKSEYIYERVIAPASKIPDASKCNISPFSKNFLTKCSNKCQ